MRGPDGTAMQMVRRAADAWCRRARSVGEVWGQRRGSSLGPGLKLTIQKTKIMASGPISSWEIDGETVETVSDFILGLQTEEEAGLP